MKLKDKSPNRHQLTTIVSWWKQKLVHQTLYLGWSQLNPWLTNFLSFECPHSALLRLFMLQTRRKFPLACFSQCNSSINWAYILYAETTLIKFTEKLYNALQCLTSNQGNIYEHVSYCEASRQLTIKAAENYRWYSSSIPILMIEFLLWNLFLKSKNLYEMNWPPFFVKWPSDLTLL